MPRIDASDDVEFDNDDDTPMNGAPAHTESAIEADVEAKDQLQDDLADDVAEREGVEAGEEERDRISPIRIEGEEDNEDEYEVEAIHGHQWKGKGRKQVLLYNVKWKGYPSSENTLEPEENLSDARDILAAYHHSIGGAPQPDSTTPSALLKSKSSRKSLRQDSSDAIEHSSTPAAKRQRRNNPEDDETESWVPKGTNWENDVEVIETVERDPLNKNLYVYVRFKNGRKSKITSEMVHKHCPRVLLRFYESHLNFN